MIQKSISPVQYPVLKAETYIPGYDKGKKATLLELHRKPCLSPFHESKAARSQFYRDTCQT